MDNRKDRSLLRQPNRNVAHSCVFLEMLSFFTVGSVTPL